MWLYEYECKSCRVGDKPLKFDAYNEIEERHTSECPQCGKLSDKVMSVVNNSFGWALDEKCHDRFGPRDKYVRDI